MNTQDDVRGEVLLERHFDLTSLAETRTSVYASLLDAGAPDERAMAFAASVSEGMTNAIRHGGGSGDLTICRDGPASVVAEVRDYGTPEPFEVPAAPPPPERLGGRGLWMASRLCDRVTILTGLRGASLILHLSFA